MFDSIRKEKQKREAEKQAAKEAFEAEKERLRKRREEAKNGFIRKNIKIVDKISSNREEKRDEKKLTEFRVKQASEIAKAQAERRNKMLKANQGKIMLASGIVVALIVGSSVFAYNSYQNNIEQRYSTGVEDILDENYPKAVKDLEDLEYNDSKALVAYAEIQSDIEPFSGKPNELLKRIQAVNGLETPSVKAQCDDAVTEIEKAVKVQNGVDDIKLEKISLESKSNLEQLAVDLDAIAIRYRQLVETEPLEEANKAVGHIENGDAIGKVIVAINEIGKVKISKEDVIKAVRESYDALSESEQKEVINASILEKKEKKLTALKREREEKIAAEKREAERKERERLEAEKQAQEEREAEEAKLDATVLVTSSGRSYHVSGCSHIIGSSTRSMTQREALNSGYTPCADCIDRFTYPQLDGY